MYLENKAKIMDVKGLSMILKGKKHFIIDSQVARGTRI